MTPHWGLGTMLSWLRGNDDEIELLKHAVGQKISTVIFDNNILIMEFESGLSIGIYDDGQSCCEYRYMTVDDQNLNYFVGTTFLGIEISEYYSNEEGYSSYDSQFLYIKTDLGVIDVCMHNEHNGYYAGFSPRIMLVNEGAKQ